MWAILRRFALRLAAFQWVLRVTAGALVVSVPLWDAQFHLLELPFVLFDIWLVFVLVRWFARYMHRIFEFKKLVHLRITLPRNDSKLDNEKRTEKDFREAVGRAEQLFRALHETRDLNLYNRIFKVWLWRKPQFSLEFQFEKREFSFVIVTDEYYREILQKQITTFYESAEIEIVKPGKRFTLRNKGDSVNGYYMYTQREDYYPIQTYSKIEDDALNNVANSFAKLEQDEKGLIQFVVRPSNDKWQKRVKEIADAMFKNQKPPSNFHIPILGPLFRILWAPFKFIFFYKGDKKEEGGYVRMLQSEEEIAKAIGEKSHQPGYEVTMRVFAASPKGPSRVMEILNGIFVSFGAFEAKGMNAIQNRRLILINAINSPWIRHLGKYRLSSSIMERSSLMGCDELATLFHFPDARYNKIPTIKWLTYKVLPPPVDLPKEGVVLGKSVYRGVEKMVHMMREDRTRHHYIIGKSGSGKSVLLWNMAVQDIENGDGVCVIDPHGDLVEDIVACVPKSRAKDVIIFDPADTDRPMGLNILEAKTTEEKDRASLDAMEIFIKLFGNEIFGPRIQHYFRNGCLTLMDDEEEGATLIDIPRLFIDDEFQKYKVAKVKNTMVRAFWENEMAQTGEREKQEMIPYFTSKFGPFITNMTMRNVIGQTKSAFNVRQVMDTQKVLMVNLSKGKVGDTNAQLLGLIMVSKINQAAMGRADMPKEDRKDLYFYVDEFQNFATDTFASILSEARKYRLNLIMAHQYIAQLNEGGGGGGDSKIKDAVFGNVGSMMSFKIGAEDAEYLEKEYAPTLSSQDILSIANYKAYVKLNINNTTSRPFSIETLYDPNKKNPKVLEILKKYSRMKYGRKKEFVNAEIEARMGIEVSTGGDETGGGSAYDAFLKEAEKAPADPKASGTPIAVVGTSDTANVVPIPMAEKSSDISQSTEVASVPETGSEIKPKDISVMPEIVAPVTPQVTTEVVAEPPKEKPEDISVMPKITPFVSSVPEKEVVHMAAPVVEAPVAENIELTTPAEIPAIIDTDVSVTPPVDTSQQVQNPSVEPVVEANPFQSQEGEPQTVERAADIAVMPPSVSEMEQPVVEQSPVNPFTQGTAETQSVSENPEQGQNPFSTPLN